MEGTAETWSAQSPRLNMIALELDGPPVGSWASGVPDDAFEHDGQLTKRDLRVGALARLAPQTGQLLWDVGAGAGSVGIEWMRAHPTCAAIAIEADPDRAARIERNADSLGVPGLQVVRGRLPTFSATCPTRTRSSSAAAPRRRASSPPACSRLRPGGRLVVHGVTLETETLLGQLYAEHGGELTRHSVEHAAPIGSFTGWTPARAVTMWAVEHVTVHFVGAGPGAADLLTLRAATLLSEAEVVLYPGTYLDEGFLGHAVPTPTWSTPRTSTSTRSWPRLIGASSDGLDVVRLVSGDPSVYSALTEQTHRLDQAGVPTGT